MCFHIQRKGHTRVDIHVYIPQRPSSRTDTLACITHLLRPPLNITKSLTDCSAWSQSPQNDR